jgi:hypothetical protein
LALEVRRLVRVSGARTERRKRRERRGEEGREG